MMMIALPQKNKLYRELSIHALSENLIAMVERAYPQTEIHVYDFFAAGPNSQLLAFIPETGEYYGRSGDIGYCSLEQIIDLAIRERDEQSLSGRA